MGDILGSVFGSGGRTTQTTTPDPNAQGMNDLRLQQLRGLFDHTSLAAFAGDSGYGQMSPDTIALLQQMTGSDNLMSLQDYVTMGTDAGKSYMSQIATPEISSALALQGMERSGALPEALAKGAASTGLQFMSTIPNFQTANMQANQAMFNLSDAPRQAALNEYMRQQGVAFTGFTGIPWTPGSSTKGSTQSLPLFDLFGMGSSL